MAREQALVTLVMRSLLLQYATICRSRMRVLGPGGRAPWKRGLSPQGASVGAALERSWPRLCGG